MYISRQHVVVQFASSGKLCRAHAARVYTSLAGLSLYIHCTCEAVFVHILPAINELYATA